MKNDTKQCLLDSLKILNSGIVLKTFTHELKIIGVAPTRQLLRSVIKIVTSTLCGKSEFPYHKELLLKERIHSLWAQILSFKRSSQFEKGYN